jgi:hypothetical protein
MASKVDHEFLAILLDANHGAVVKMHGQRWTLKPVNPGRRLTNWQAAAELNTTATTRALGTRISLKDLRLNYQYN